MTAFVVVRLDARRYAVALAAVERTVRAVEVTPLPHAPAVVLGAINLQGRVLPVIDLRRQFRLPERPVGLSDWFLIAHTARHSVGLVVDEVEGVTERHEADVVPSAEIVPGLKHIQGTLKLDDELVSILDVEGLLSVDEAQALEPIA
jgi:purine-binding chemotaxis protein CheW